MIADDEAIDIAVSEWEHREKAREADAMEATLEVMRSKLASRSIEWREDGCNQLCTFIIEHGKAGAATISHSFLELLCAVLREAHAPRVARAASSAVPCSTTPQT